MMSLDEAWGWYQQTRHSLRVTHRLADRYWTDLPWDGSLGKDNVLRDVEGPQLVESVKLSLLHLDDLAIVALFSVFETLVRDRLSREIEDERPTIRHPLLQFACEEALEEINRGSFARVLQSLKKTDHRVVEQVRQIRRYRNWVSHGRRGPAPFQLTPKDAYERLRTFLSALDRTSPGFP